MKFNTSLQSQNLKLLSKKKTKIILLLNKKKNLTFTFHKFTKKTTYNLNYPIYLPINKQNILPNLHNKIKTIFTTNNKINI